MRQLLADKACGNLVGLWLLVAEHLRLGTWDLLCGWTGQPTAHVEPRLALQLIHEAALCTTGVRAKRALSQNGFELLNGLPWLATDTAIHQLLAARTVAEIQRLQVALGKLRRTAGHFQGNVLAIDPHRLRSYSKRQMRGARADAHSRALKMSPTFFVLDADTQQPVCCTTATAARSVTTASAELLGLAAAILDPKPGQCVVAADAEHFSARAVGPYSTADPFRPVGADGPTEHADPGGQDLHAPLGGLCDLHASLPTPGAAKQDRERSREAAEDMDMTRRSLCVIIALGIAAGSAQGQDVSPADSVVWKKVHASVFGNAALEAADNVVALDTPKRAEDAAIVPLAIRSQFPQTKERYIETIWLIIDNNPSPIAAVFHFTLQSGRADIETRIRIEEYTYVRAVAQTNDGKLYMVANYVKAAGGCSAPAGKDAVAAQANLGKMRFRVGDTIEGRPAVAQLMISHPNDSGLAMDQVTRSYATPHFVRSVEVRYGGNLIMSADVDFSISENPNFRFYFVPTGDDELDAKVVDNQDLEFRARVKLDSARMSAVSTPH